MPFLKAVKRCLRVPTFLFFFTISLFFSLFALAQVTLKHRLLNGYALSSDAPVNKGKPTLFVFEQAETLSQVFKPAAGGKRPDRSAGPAPDFSTEMVIGIAVPPTNKPPKLSISKVFVQDSTLTVRYVRMADTTAAARTPDGRTTQPSSSTSPPILLLAIPKQTVLKTRLVENGKVIQTIRKREE